MERTRYQELNVNYRNLPESSAENVLITEWYGPALPPEDELCSWFATNPNDAVTLHFAAGFDAEAESTQPGSLRAIASRLGIELSVDGTVPGSVFFEGHEDAVVTLEFALMARHGCRVRRTAPSGAVEHRRAFANRDSVSRQRARNRDLTRWRDVGIDSCGIQCRAVMGIPRTGGNRLNTFRWQSPSRRIFARQFHFGSVLRSGDD